MTQTTHSSALSAVPDTPTRRDPPGPIIAPEGAPIVLGFVVVSLVVSIPAVYFLGPWGYGVAGICAALCLWCLWFFRDPARAVPMAPGVVVAPADGRVVLVGPASPPPELEVPAAHQAGMIRICIFMNVFNVHVNRAPVEGTIAAIRYRAGAFLNASLDKASEKNERSSMAMMLHDGRWVVVVQIAGLVARRIVSRVQERQALARGERYGLIRFGSRVDVYLPAGATPCVLPGQRTIAGESIIGRLNPTN